MAAKIGKGPRSLVVLGRTSGENLHWISADRTVLVTRRGRLVQTAGLPFNLRHTELLDDDPLASLSRQDAPIPPFKRVVDLAPPDRYGVVIEASLETIGLETIEIAELEFKTVAYREDCRAQDMDWRFKNLFWASPANGLIWKSLQHVHPEVPPVELELLKPAA